MPVDSAGGANFTTISTLQAALLSGDMEAVLIAFAIERAEFADQAVRDKITGMREKNQKIAQLSEIREIFAGVEDKDGKTITKDSAQLEKLGKYLEENPELLQKIHGGMNFYDKDGKQVYPESGGDWSKITEIKVEHWQGNNLETVKTVLQNEVDALKSNEQLEMVELQRLVSLQNNAFEMASNLSKKFENTKSSITRNMS